MPRRAIEFFAPSVVAIVNASRTVLFEIQKSALSFARVRLRAASP